MIRRIARRLLNRRPADVTPIGELPPGTVGRGTYGPALVRSFTDSGSVTIGSYCSFAQGVEIWRGGNHRMDWVTTYPFTIIDKRWSHIDGGSKSKGNVVIGSDVWFGRDALVLSGVTIGHGAVIGARAVVGRDVPPYSVVVGNPGRAIRTRFSPEIVERLLALAWWDWDLARVERAVPAMMSDDIEGFLEKAERGEL